MIPEGVWIAIIGGLVAMYVATIPLLLSARKYARTASEQVTNAHEVNLRDDLDDKHADNAGRLGRLEKGYTTMRNDIGSLKRGMSRIEEHLGIEHTIQPAPRRKK